MATNAEIETAYNALQTAYRTDVYPKIVATHNRVKAGAGWPEVEAEYTFYQSEFDKLYDGILTQLNQAKANDPQNPDLIARIEKSYNVNRLKNLDALQSQIDRAKRNTPPPEEVKEEAAKVEEEAKEEERVAENPPTEQPVTTNAEPPQEIKSLVNSVVTNQTPDGILEQTSEKKVDKDSIPSKKLGGKNFYDGANYPNPLLAYDSFTYGISLYMLSFEDYNEIAEGTSTKTTFPKSKLLIASGGRRSGDYTRDENFKTEFFIEDFNMESVINTTTYNRNSNTVSGEFKIIEPYGFSLINRLISTASQIDGESIVKFTQRPYLVKIDFFGHNVNEDKLADAIPDMSKYIPINIITMSVDLSEKGTEYSVSFVPYNHIAASEKTSTLPTAMSISGTTVKEMLGRFTAEMAETDDIGEWVYRGTGLTERLYQYHIELVQSKKATYADEYVIELDPEIGNAKIFESKSPTDKIPEKPDSATKKLNKIKGSKDINPSAIEFNFPANSKIDAIIDYVVRNSTYVPKQLKDVTQANKENEPLNWIKVTSKVKRIGYDPLRDRNIYRTTYSVRPYKKHSTHPDAPSGRYLGKQVKRYEYFFTGKNAEILDLRLNFNVLYYTSVPAFLNRQTNYESNSTLADAGIQKNKLFDKVNNINGSDNVQKVATTTDPIAINPIHHSTTQGSKGVRGGNDSDEVDITTSIVRSNELTADGDLINLEMEIIGDPLFIKQDDLFYQTGLEKYTSIRTKNNSFYMDDGELYCLVIFRTPTDYDFSTGLTDLDNSENFGYSEFTGVYRIFTIKNTFSGGKFTQKLTMARINNDKSIEIKKQQQEQTQEELAARPLDEKPININENIPTVSMNQQVQSIVASKQQGGASFLTGGILNIRPQPAPEPTPEDYAEADRINREENRTPETEITAEQVASNRSLNQSLTASFGFPPDSKPPEPFDPNEGNG